MTCINERRFSQLKKLIIAGEIRYGKNGHTIATLMFVDKTLPLWAFFDVYGSTQKIKSLGKYFRFPFTSFLKMNISIS